MIERIEKLRTQAESEISATSNGEELAELRVRYLGRKAELPQMLRGVAQLPADERATVGKAANEARQALEALIDDRAAQLQGAPSKAAKLGADEDAEQVLTAETVEVGGAA